MGDFINLAELFEKTPINKAIDEINETHGIPKDIPKKHGWNFWRRFLACPHSAWLKYKERVEEDLRERLEVGIAVHGFLQWYYLGLEASELKDALIAHNTTVQWVLEAWRIYQSYAIHFSSDALFNEVRAVESWLVHPLLDYCCRQDLVVDIGENEDGIIPGLWIVDHKTSARFDEAMTNCWAHDGEVLGLQMTYRAAGSPFGELRGVLINLIGKQKTPKYARIPISINEKHLALFEDSIAEAHVERMRLDQTGNLKRYGGTWPRRGHETGNCVGRYGTCEYYERCWMLP